MLKCEVGTEKGSILAKGSPDDIAVDIAYIVARVYNTIKMQSDEGAEELRVNLQKLMAPGSPVWEAPEGARQGRVHDDPEEGGSDGWSVRAAPGVRRFMTVPVSATAADAGRAAMRTELMACPWCRSTCLNEDFDEEGWYVECNGCLARGPVADTPEEAEAAWNRRA